MPQRKSPTTGSELFIVDNSDDEWKALRYLRDWCDYAKGLDVASAYFEIGSLLALDGQWQKVDGIRVLMGDEVAARTKAMFNKALSERVVRLDDSIEREKEKDDFLEGVPGIVEAIRAGKIKFRVYRKEKFHAKAYITHARSEVLGSAALVGSSNFTRPGLTQNVELNVRIDGIQVSVLQEWYEQYWDEAEDITPEMLQVIERHIEKFTPFDVYAQSLREYFKRREITAGEWEKSESAVWPRLDGYQREGYGQLLKIADKFGGAFLCDGVGLGKTFIGLMLLERLAVHENKRVALIVPKSGRVSVWESNLKRLLPKLKGGAWNNLLLLNHTDLNRASKQDDIDAIATKCDAIIIDEAHNFRNPGLAGSGRKKESRYRVLQRIAQGKKVFMLTATPVNNGVYDLMHLIELFSADPQAFREAGVNSLQGHFRQLEKSIREATHTSDNAAPEDDVDQTVEFGAAREAFAKDPLVNALVVQRSRAYVKLSQSAEAKGQAVFPVREDPIVAAYELTPLQSQLLELVDESFQKRDVLFRLAMYNPTPWLKEEDPEKDLATGRLAQVVRLIRTGFLKRLESSTPAFELSCHRLFVKLLTFWSAHARTEGEKAELAVWERRNAEVIAQVKAALASHAGEETDEDDGDALITDEMIEDVEALKDDKYKMSEMLAETAADLNQLAKLLAALKPFTPEVDGKLAALKKLLTGDPVLSKHKVLLFTEYQGTARYLKRELIRAGFDGVEAIDSASHEGAQREAVIRRFAPYYNGTTSAGLAADGQSEIRILIATDVLSEGLNLQDGTRLINYDLHWNPVRLMQRIGRVDRRLNPEIEAQLLHDHPDVASLRGRVTYWNFLPNQALETLLRLYKRVADKTLRISRLFGIEGRRLLKPSDDFDDLKELNEQFDSEMTKDEVLRRELRALLDANPDLEARLVGLPNRVFSGREAISATGVFFCYALPGRSVSSDGEERWDVDEARQVRWYFYDLETAAVLSEVSAVADRVRSQPVTARRSKLDRATLKTAREAVEKHLTNGYLRQVQAPVGAKPILKAWMELN